MRNSISVLRATTAIMVSLSFIGAHAGAAELRLAQAKVEQPAEQGQGEQQPTGEQAPDAEAQSDGSVEPATTQPQAAGQGQTDQNESANQAGDLSVTETPSAEERQSGETQSTESESAETQSSGETAAKPTEQGQAAEQAPAAEQEEAGETAAETQPETQPGAKVEAQATESGAVTTDQEAGQESGAETQSPEGSGSAAGEAATEAATPATEGQSEATTEASPAGTETEGEAAPAAPAETQPQTQPQAGADAQASEAATEQPTEGQTQPQAGAETPAAAAVETQPQADTPAAAETQPQAGTETQAGTEVQTGTETPATGAQAISEAQAPAAAGVTEQEVEAAAVAGEDVVVEEANATETEELERQLEELRQQNADLASQLQQGQAVDVQEEVVTEDTSRSATEEVDEDDDGNNVWKYLGAAAGGAVVGALVPVLGGRLVQDQGDRVVVERGGEFFVRKDETQLLRQPGARVQTETFDGGVTRQTVTREDGSQVVTVRNQGGFILRRTRITPDGQEIVLLEQTPEELYDYSDWQEQLPPATAHGSRTVDYASADPDAVRRTLQAQPVYQLERSYPLQAVREVEQVRELVPAVDLPINFASGSAAIQRAEVEDLTALGRMMSDVIDENPREIFLVEGHTDAVGSNVMNLALSDRRAEAVALALTEYFDIPPENLIVQGYGERFLKEQTQAASPTNRRATVRRITPLIDRVAAR